MNRLNRLCRCEEMWAKACVEAGNCFSFRDEYHRIRDAIRYNSKESAFYGRLEKARATVEENIYRLILKWYPNLTDWKITVGKPMEEKKRVNE